MTRFGATPPVGLKLGDDQRVALNAAIRQTAAFARQFRTALELDIEDASFRRAEFRIEPHREIAAEARVQEIIGESDHETLKEMAEAAVTAPQRETLIGTFPCRAASAALPGRVITLP